MSLPLEAEVMAKKADLEALGPTINHIVLAGSRVHKTDQSWSDYDFFYLFTGATRIDQDPHTITRDGVFLTFVGFHSDEFLDMLKKNFWTWEQIRSPLVYHDDGKFNTSSVVFDDLNTLDNLMEDMAGYAQKIPQNRDTQVIWKYYSRAIQIGMKMKWIQENQSHLYPLDVNVLLTDLAGLVPVAEIASALSNPADGWVTPDDIILDWLDGLMSRYYHP